MSPYKLAIQEGIFRFFTKAKCGNLWRRVLQYWTLVHCTKQLLEMNLIKNLWLTLLKRIDFKNSSCKTDSVSWCNE